MTGDRSLDGDGCSFAVTNFADHNDVRVLTQNRTQGVGEGQLGLDVDLYLIDAFDVGFYGVFNSDDVDAVAVELAQSGVQRGGLTGTGGACYQNDAVGVVHNAVKLDQIIGRQTEGLLAAVQRFFLVQSHDALFAVNRRQCGDTDIVFTAVNGHRETAVLRLSLFRDVHAADNLDTGNDRGQQLGIVLGGGVQGTVNTVADTNAVGACFDVNIGCTLTNRLFHQRVDQHNHGGRVDVLADDLVFHGSVDFVVAGIKLGCFHHFIGAVITVDGQQNVRGRCQIGANTALACDGNQLAAAHIHGVVQRDEKNTLIVGIESERQNGIRAQDVGTNQLTDFHRDVLLVELDDRQSGNGSQSVQQLFFGKKALFQNQFTNGAAFFLVFVSQQVGLCLTQETVRNQIF